MKQPSPSPARSASCSSRGCSRGDPRLRGKEYEQREHHARADLLVVVGTRPSVAGAQAALSAVLSADFSFKFFFTACSRCGSTARRRTTSFFLLAISLLPLRQVADLWHDDEPATVGHDGSRHRRVAAHVAPGRATRSSSIYGRGGRDPPLPGRVPVRVEQPDPAAGARAIGPDRRPMSRSARRARLPARRPVRLQSWQSAQPDQVAGAGPEPLRPSNPRSRLVTVTLGPGVRPSPHHQEESRRTTR